MRILSVKLQGTDGQKANGCADLYHRADVAIGQWRYRSVARQFPVRPDRRSRSKAAISSRSCSAGHRPAADGNRPAVGAEGRYRDDAGSGDAFGNRGQGGRQRIFRGADDRPEERRQGDGADRARYARSRLARRRQCSGPVQDPANGELSTSPVGLPAWSGLDVDARCFRQAVLAGCLRSGVGLDRQACLEGRRDRSSNAVPATGWAARSRAACCSANADGTGFLQTRLDAQGCRPFRRRLDGATARRSPTASSNCRWRWRPPARRSAQMANSLSGSGDSRRSAIPVVHGLNTGASFPDLLAAADPMQEQITAGKPSSDRREALLAGEAELGRSTVPFNIAGGTLRAQNVTAGDAAASLSADARNQLSRRADAARSARRSSSIRARKR